MPTILLAQIEASSDPLSTRRKVRQAFAAAHQAGATMLVFPEGLLGFRPQSAFRAERWQAAETLLGEGVQDIQRLAAETGIWTVFGMIERPQQPDERRRLHSCVVVVSASGEVAGVYRKTHLYDAFGYRESDAFTPGDEIFRPIDTPCGRLGLLVCYELRFPEVARVQALQGAEILVVPSAWYSGPLKEMHFELLARARALENGVYLCACDQAGNGFVGHSIVADPLGVPVAMASEQADQTIAADLSLQRVRDARSLFSYLSQRRPELYAEMTLR